MIAQRERRSVVSRIASNAIAIATALSLTGCGAMMVPGDGAADARDSASADRGTIVDASATEDSAVEDAAASDDAAVLMDASVALDASTAMDARVTDARVTDARVTDARVTDARVTDTGTDARVTDASADGGYALTGLPTCAPANVTAAMLYGGAVSVSCTGARCHDPGSSGTLFMGSAAQMRTNLLARSRTADIPRVTPRDLNNSYVMYKLLNQHLRITGGAGNRMPPAGALPNAQLCLFVNWIRTGAM